VKRWIAVLFFPVLLVTSVFALNNKAGPENTAKVLRDLEQKQGVEWPRQIDVTRLSDTDLGRLGRALWKETANGEKPVKNAAVYRALARQYLRGIPGSSGFDECYGRYGMMGGMMGGWGNAPWNGSWHWIGGWIMGILFLVLVVVVIYLLVKGSGFNIRELKGSENALEILRKRYARGEITKDEFEAMKKDLS